MALLHVDGVTVNRPLLEALAIPLVDIPLLMQSSQAEMEGLAPDRATVGIDVAGLAEFWHILFAPAYGADMAQQETELHHNETIVAPELSVYALDSDTGTACAIRELAKSGGTAFASPIYVGYVTGMPSHAPPSGPKFAYHGWDFKTATATWGGYVPSAQDLNFGSSLLTTWSSFATYGRLAPTSGWISVQDNPGWPAHYFTADVGRNGSRVVLDMKSSVCAWWRKWGVFSNWWWMN